QPGVGRAVPRRVRRSCARLQLRIQPVEHRAPQGVAMARSEETIVTDAVAAGIRGRTAARLALHVRVEPLQLLDGAARGDGIVRESDAEHRGADLREYIVG